jgi:FkbM family methyltransferase
MEKIKLFNKILNPAGLNISKYLPSNSDELRLKKLLELKQIDLVIDVGANDGRYGKMLREIGYRGKIISFEPLETPYKKLLQKSKRDKDWIVADRMAIGESDDFTEINISNNIDSSSILNMSQNHLDASPESVYIAKEKIQVRSLDGLMNEVIHEGYSNGFIKIDVQGYEWQVLKGAQKLIDELKGIQIELSLLPLYEGQKLYKEIMEYIYSRHFNLYMIYPGFTDQKNGRMLQMDGVFFKE